MSENEIKIKRCPVCNHDYETYHAGEWGDDLRPVYKTGPIISGVYCDNCSFFARFDTGSYEGDIEEWNKMPRRPLAREADNE